MPFEVKSPSTSREPVYVLEKSLRGTIAHYAVSQSPYACPEGLAEVLAEVQRRFRADPKVETMGLPGAVRIRALEPTFLAAKAYVRALLWDQPQFQAWNVPKKGNARMGIVGFGLPSVEPDCDFIDLDAIVQNVAGRLLEI